MPAAGFALSLERVMIALAAQRVTVPVRGLDVVVGGEPADVARVCARLRAGGWRVLASIATERGALVEQARGAGALSTLLAGEAAAVLLDGGSIRLEPLGMPPTLSEGAPHV
jgi:histidyl-tRNA synthetase